MSTPSNQNNNMPGMTSSKTVIGNTNIPAEIERLRAMPYTTHQFDNLKVSDLSTLEALTQEDKTATEFVQDAKWIIEQKEYEHVTHSFYALSEYVRTGTHEMCLPQELSHVYLSLQHNDLERAKNAIPKIQMDQDAWLTEAEQKFKPFPSYYKSYLAIKDDIIKVIPQLTQNKFDEETMTLLQHISGNVVC